MQQVGGWLKHAREARGLSLQAIASQTKISPHHLEALERGDMLKLPRFYQRAEIRAVARAVGVDEQLALARLEAELPPVETRRPTPPPDEERVRWAYLLAMAGAGVLATALAGWGSFERAAVKADKVATPVPITASPAPPPAAAPAAAPLPPPEPVSAPAVETVAVAPAPDVPVVAIASAGATELDIWTEPDGARVTVNGIGWGVAPIFIRHLEPGEQRIRVTMDGYAATERSVVLDGGSRQSVSIGLEPE